MKYGKALAVALVFTAGAAAFLFWGATRQGAAAVKAAVFLSDFAEEFNVAVPRLPFTAKAPVEKQTAAFLSGGETIAADFYLPQKRSKKLPAMVFAYGLVDEINEERIVKLSESLARSGFMVLVPRFPDLLSGRVHERSATHMVDAFRFLQGQSFVDARRVGFMGFCVGGSLALVAASNPEIASDVAFVYAVSPYFDFFSFGETVFSKTYETKGEIVSWNPHPQTGETFRNELTLLLPERDQTVVRHALVLGVLNEAAEQSLSSDGKLVWRIFQAQSLAEVRNLSAQLSDVFFKANAARSPSQNLHTVSAPVYLLAGLDTFIPFSETQRLAEALGKGATFSHSRLLLHVDPTRRLPWHEQWREGFLLWNHVRKMFASISLTR